MSDIISLNSEISIWFFFIVCIFLLRFTIFSLIRSTFSSKSLKVETCLLIQISASSESEKWKSLSHVRLFATPGTVQSVELFRPENWSGVAFPFSRGSSPPRSLALQADSLPAEPQGKPSVGHLAVYFDWFLFPCLRSHIFLLLCVFNYFWLYVRHVDVTL